jgi:hypothetical protein
MSTPQEILQLMANAEKKRAEDFEKGRAADAKRIEDLKKQRLLQQELHNDRQPNLVPTVSPQPQAPVNQQFEARIKALEAEVDNLKGRMAQERINKLENGLCALEGLFSQHQARTSESTASCDTKEGLARDVASRAAVAIKKSPPPPPPVRKGNVR